MLNLNLLASLILVVVPTCSITLLAHASVTSLILVCIPSWSTTLVAVRVIDFMRQVTCTSMCLSNNDWSSSHRYLITHRHLWLINWLRHHYWCSLRHRVNLLLRISLRVLRHGLRISLGRHLSETWSSISLRHLLLLLIYWLLLISLSWEAAWWERVARRLHHSLSHGILWLSHLLLLRIHLLYHRLLLESYSYHIFSPYFHNNMTTKPSIDICRLCHDAWGTNPPPVCLGAPWMS